MADETVQDFEDRWSDVPAEPDATDPQIEQKKAELLKLATPPAPVAPVTTPTGRDLTSLLTPTPMAPPQPELPVAQTRFAPPTEEDATLRQHLPDIERVRNLPVRQVPEMPVPPPSPSAVLAAQRAPYKIQVEANPMLKMKFAALMSAEEGSKDRASRVALAESALNRAKANGVENLDQIIGNKAYYQPYQNRTYYTHLARIMNDPKYRAEVYQDMDEALNGSDVSKLATHNASGSVAAHSLLTQTPTYQGANKEGFFRKDINPQIHGARRVANEQSWVATTQQEMANAVPQDPTMGGQMLSSSPIAEQLIKMHGGLPDTPQARAMVQGLFAPQGLDQPRTQGRVTPAYVPIGEEQKPNLSPTQKTRVQVQGQLPQAPGQMPVPYTLPQPQLPEGKPDPIQAMIQNPSVLSTVGNWLNQRPESYAPAPAPGLMDEAMDVARTAAAATAITPDAHGALDLMTAPGVAAAKFYTNLSNQMKDWLQRNYDIGDLSKPDTWTPETGQKLIKAGGDALRNVSKADQAFTKGAVQGMTQRIPMGLLGFGSQLTGLGYSLSGGNQSIGDLHNWMMNTAPDAVARFSQEASGQLRSDEPLDLFKAGHMVGFTASPNPLSMGANVAGYMYGNDVLQWMNRNAPQLPNLSFVSNADAMDLSNQQGKNNIVINPDGTRIIAKTPAGDTVIDPRTANSLGWMGLATLGFMFAPGLLRAAWMKGAPTPGNAAWLNEVQNAPKSFGIGPDLGGTKGQLFGGMALRDVPGGINMAQGSPFDAVSKYVRGVPEVPLIKSTVLDYLKAQTLSTKSPMTDVLERWVRMTPGADPKAAARVIDTTHIYSDTGVRNFIGAAMNNGRMQSPTLRFVTQNTMNDLKQFALANDTFRDYMRYNIIGDHLEHYQFMRQQSLNNPNSRLTSAQLNRRYPPFIMNERGVNVSLNDVNRVLQNFEQANPNLRQGYNMYMDYLNEGKRFVSSGQYAPENWQALQDYTVHAGHTPIFSTNKARLDVWNEVRKGGDPLHILERELGKSMADAMHSESHGQYIDAAPEAWLPATPDFLRARTIDDNAVFTQRLDGVDRKLVGDPMIVGLMKMNPAGYSSGLDSVFRTLKGAFQWGTTSGPLAHYFAWTANARAFEQQLVSAPAWLRRPGILSATNEIPRAWSGTQAGLYSNFINATANRLANSGFGNIVGPQNVNLVARILTAETARQFNRQVQTAGGMNRDWLDAMTPLDRQNYINRAKNVSPDPQFQNMLNYLGRTVQPIAHGFEWVGHKGRDVADAPATAMIRKNYGQGLRRGGPQGRIRTPTTDPVTGQPVSLNKMVAESRRLTGDPAERGAGWWENYPGGKPQRLPYQASSDIEQAGVKAARGVGSFMDVYHKLIPWSGTLVRSPTSTLTAMANNPYRSAAWLAATQIIPEMASYGYAWTLGPAYVNYMMEGRSENTRNNYTYVPVPGKPPWEGVEIPNYQEGIPFRQSALKIVDQMVGRSAFTPRDEMVDYLNSIWKTMVEPPLPSPVTAVLGLAGVTAPEGLTGGTFMAKDQGFKDFNKPDNMFERLLRNVAPVIADYWTQYYNAVHNDDSTIAGMLVHGPEAVGHRVLQRTPMWRDIATAAGLGDFKPPTAASTRITDEIYRNDKTIDFLSRAYASAAKPGMINTKGKTAGGMNLQRQNMPDLVPPIGKASPSAGLPQPPATNPLFLLAQKGIEQAFIKDAPQKGGQGYKSMWSVYGYYSRQIDSMRNVNEGNPGPWLQRFQKQPNEIARLKKEGVDTTDFRDVKNYYTYQRDRVAKEIMLYVNAAEQQIDRIPAVRQELQKYEQTTGQPVHFKLWMADPYKPGLNLQSLQ